MVSHGAFLRADGSTRLCCMAFDGRAGRQLCLQRVLAEETMKKIGKLMALALARGARDNVSIVLIKT
jgi:hypothetical protein